MEKIRVIIFLNVYYKQYIIKGVLHKFTILVVAMVTYNASISIPQHIHYLLINVLPLYIIYKYILKENYLETKMLL